MPTRVLRSQCALRPLVLLLQCQNDGTGAYEKQKERVVDSIIARLEADFRIISNVQSNSIQAAHVASSAGRSSAAAGFPRAH